MRIGETGSFAVCQRARVHRRDVSGGVFDFHRDGVRAIGEEGCVEFRVNRRFGWAWLKGVEHADTRGCAGRDTFPSIVVWRLRPHLIAIDLHPYLIYAGTGIGGGEAQGAGAANGFACKAAGET